MLSPIRKARYIEGLTQIELAKKMGVTPGAVCQWETGKAMPDVARLKRLAEVLHTSVSDLIAEPEGRKKVI